MKRFKLGPVIGMDLRHPDRPDAPGPDRDFPEVTAAVTAVETSGDGEHVDVEVAVEIPPYNPTASIPIDLVHAVFIPEGHGLPDSAEGYVLSSYPKAVRNVSGVFAGVEILRAEGLNLGQTTIQIVLEGDDEIPATPG